MKSCYYLVSMDAIINSTFEIGYAKAKIAALHQDLPFDAEGLSILLGNNGAGKTTFLKTICGSIPPLAGKVPGCQKVYLPEELDFPPLLTTQEILRMLFPSVASTIELSILLGISGNVPYQNLSKGNKQKLRVLVAEQFACILEAKILCLDEPLSGLDAISRKLLIDIWSRKRAFPDVFSRTHRIISMHSGEAPPSCQSIVVDGGKIYRLPPIENCDRWMEFAIDHGVQLTPPK